MILLSTGVLSAVSTKSRAEDVIFITPDRRMRKLSRVPQSETISMDGPVGELEGVLELPAEAAPIAVAVICHPHPVHGGTLQNKVVHTLSRAFSGQNIGALRFNFRGVGKSAGSYDNGEGEVEDVLSVAAFASKRFQDLPIWLAGFSFGAAMAIRATASLEVAGLVSIAPAVSRFADTNSVQPDCPWLIVQGDNDELVDLSETIEWVNSMEPGPELSVFPDTTHFFHGKLIELRDTVSAFISKY